ncbi:dephospho-CoA kinase [Thalassotalea sp. LPB0316]|uniref:dephospho-CoA kinase n=1 Tax=Thalassotalea sp. LPB0316 TaxID=2769490 RepID=UPI001866F237|nr:dephospho-CoA kinase [Thalassotalea sp. LPB0316]QOL25890.1 dephospho-CoA kinase [Thalassotalea sp. LPB0316]
MSNKYIVGLTGGIGSGKTTIANRFIEKGIDVVDADEVARQVVEPGRPALTAIANHFGQDFIQANGSLNRTKLREKVFADEQAKLWLNQLLHPAIRQEMLAQLANSNSDYCLLVAPLLLENKLEQYVDTVLVIDVDEATQLARTANRDGSSEKTIKSIIASQISRKDRLARADHVIDNQHTDAKALATQIDKLDHLFTQQAAIKRARVLN